MLGVDYKDWREKMKKRTLGHTNIEVSAIALGTMGMDHAYGPQKDRKEMIVLLRKAVELGCNFFDTAVVYGEENEMLLGEAFEPIREQVVLATKFGIVGQEIVDDKPQNILNSQPESIREQLEGSLKRLRTDVIDLYYQHRVDPNVEPETVATTMKELIEEGKIKAWGLSNAPIDYIRRTHAVCPLSAIENQWFGANQKKNYLLYVKN
jgi:aryl-alcohol dehydrogenase-like predicted oxidoreductase